MRKRVVTRLQERARPEPEEVEVPRSDAPFEAAEIAARRLAVAVPTGGACVCA